MPNAELIMTELETLPPSYRDEVLDFIGYLKQKAGVSHAAAPSPKKAGLPDAAKDNPNIIPAWKLFGLPRAPTPEETDAAIKRGCGIAARIGSTFSSDKLLENRRKDKEMENAKIRRWFHKDGTELGSILRLYQ
jgi:hypothetical protein